MSAFFYVSGWGKLCFTLRLLCIEYRSVMDRVAGVVLLFPVHLFLTTAFVPLSIETAPKDLRFPSFYSENFRDRVNLRAKYFFK